MHPIRSVWPVLVALTALVGVGVVAWAQDKQDDLVAKQVTMLAAEAQFFQALAARQKEDLDKLRATPPCAEPKP
jgi:hypothetical protein